MFINAKFQFDFLLVISDSRNFDNKLVGTNITHYFNGSDSSYEYGSEAMAQKDYNLFQKLGKAINSGEVKKVTEIFKEHKGSSVNVNFMMDCINFTMYCLRRNSLVVSELVSDMVNSSCKKEKFVTNLLNDHPTLQQSFVRKVIVPYLRGMAVKRSDARNECSVQLAKEVLPIIEKFYFPFI